MCNRVKGLKHNGSTCITQYQTNLNSVLEKKKMKTTLLQCLQMIDVNLLGHLGFPLRHDNKHFDGMPNA